MIKTYPVKVGIYDDGVPVAKVEAFDEACSNVTISTVVSVHSWPELSKAIQEALRQIHPDGTEGQ